MDKTIEQLFKVFNHIVRELQVYFINGLLVLLNIYAIDFFYYDTSLFKIVGQKQFIIPLAIVAYIVGHICMAFFYVLLEWTKLDIKLNKWFGFNYKVDSSILPSIYKADKDAYAYFIERYGILTMMRWTMSAAFFINFLADIYFTIFHAYKWQVCLLTVLSFLASFCMYILTCRSENDYAERIQSMKNSS